MSTAPLTGADVDRLRAETPGCGGLVAHFNHAGSSPMPAAALNAVTEHLQREALYGPMEAGAAASDRVEAARAAAAELLNASADEVAFVGSGSEGFGLAFAALPPLRSGDRILVGRHEWGGNLANMERAAARAGARIEVISCDETGAVDPLALERMIDDRVRLVALTWLPANGGLINPAAAVGQVTRRAGVPYSIDAGQALGQVPVDVAALACDVLKGAGRKHLRGPRGTGLLYVRRGFLATLDPPYLDVLSAPWAGDGFGRRGDARLFETSERPVALLLGLGAAIRHALDLGLDRIQGRIAAISDLLREQLAAVGGVTLRDLGPEEPGSRSGLVSFTLDGLAPADVKRRLAERGFVVMNNGVPYTPLDMRARGLTEVVRASVSTLTSEDEVGRLANAVRGLAAAGPPRRALAPASAGP